LARVPVPARSRLEGVAELGELLPAWVNSAKNNVAGAAWFCADVEQHVQRPSGFTKLLEADTEADARAKMLVYLLENELLPTSL
jgi:hypothetical protein